MLRRGLERSALAVVAVAAGLLVGELGLRALLFGEVPGLGAVSRRLRDPSLFADPYEGEVYWMLRHLFGLTATDRAPGAHPDFGWTVPAFRPLDLRHVDEGRLGPKRPVLLFGDSFTRCLTPAADCFQGLARDLPLDRAAEVLNYGVGGYGLDQIQLLADATLRRWDALVARDPDRPRPVVAVAIYFEDDLDRATMGVRGWVKPRYRLTASGLELERPTTPSTAEHIARRGTGVRSWLWRQALYGRGWFPGARRAESRAHRERVEALTTALVDRLVGALEDRGLEYFFVLLPGEPALRRDRWGWREALVEDAIRARGARFVTARRDFECDREDQGRTPADYHGHGRPLFGHYNRLGNQVALLALLRGLAGEDDGGRPLEGAALAHAARASLQVQRARNAGRLGTPPRAEPRRPQGRRAADRR